MFRVAGLRSGLTRVDGRNDALDNDDGKSIQTRQSSNNLPDSRQLGHHVQEQRNQRHDAQIQHRERAVPLLGPLGEDEALGALAPDDGAQEAEDEHGQGRGECVDEHALDASDGGELRVGEEDAGAEGCSS